MDRADTLPLKYPLHLAFLRRQFHQKRLRFVFGAGVSQPIDYPTWSELVGRIADEVGAKDLVSGKVDRATLTAKVQYLYEHYISAQIQNAHFKDPRFKKEEARARWNSVLRSCLYENTKDVKEHPYLTQLGSLIRDSKFLITYNFDDTIETLIGRLVPAQARYGKKAFETIWSLTSQLREDVLTIYHPNGFIPSNRHDYSSDRIVFSDESFSNQIAGEQPGSHSFIHHFLQNTCILFGLSLDDVSLRQHLRRLALMAPGLNHVLVAHYSPSNPYSPDQQAAIAAANFEVYNLLTLFLTNEDITALCELIAEDKVDFSDRAARLGVPVKYVYYITGGVAAGKTTAVSQFGSCHLYDEWVEPSPPIVSKPFNTLTPEEKTEANSWIGRQFELKNRALRSCNEGIHIIDRAPLDPLSFETSSQQKRAQDLVLSFRPGAALHKVEPGQVIFLQCPEAELRRRLISKNKFWDENTISSNIIDLVDIYRDDIYYIESFGSGVFATAKDISRLIFLQKYSPTNLDNILIDRAK